MSDEWVDVAYGPPASSTDEWVDVAYGPPADQSLSGRFMTGVGNAPRTLKDLVVQTYNFARNNPIQTIRENPRQAIDVAGQFGTVGASAASGATGGAALGALGGPLAPVTVPAGAIIGGGIGATLGALGYQKGKELTGAEAPTDMTPGDVAEMLGTNAALSALPAVVKGTAKTVGAIAEAPARILGRTARGLEEEALGITKAQKRAINAKAPTYLDDQGNIVTQAQAVEELPPLEARLQNFRERGMMKQLSDDPYASQKAIQANSAQLAQEQSALAKQADAKATAIDADFRATQAYIDDVRQVDPMAARSMQRVLDNRLALENQQPPRFSEALKVKRLLAQTGDYKNPNQPTQNKTFYRKLEQAYRKALDDAAPNQQAWRKVNQSLDTNISFENALKNRATVDFGALPLFRKTALINSLLAGTSAFSQNPIPILTAAFYTGAKAKPALAAKITRAMESAARVPAIPVLATGKALPAGTSPIVQALIQAYGSSAENALPAATANNPQMENIPQLSVTNPNADIPPQKTTSNPTTNSAESRANALSLSERDSTIRNVTGSSEVIAKLLSAIRHVETGGEKEPAKAVGRPTRHGTAKGAFQILDSTGKELHRRLGLKDAYDPHDEKQQTQLAVYHLTELLAKYRDPYLAAAAWNTGETNLDRAIRLSGSSEWNTLYRRLPNESRAYVPRVVKQLL